MVNSLTPNVVDLMRTAAKKFGDKVAYIDDKGEITFSQLLEFSTRLSRRIPSTEAPILLAFPPGIGAVTIILACVMAGRVYAPLDPSIPPERLRSILMNFTESVIICEYDFAQKIRGTVGAETNVLTLDQVKNQSEHAGQGKKNLDDPLYIIHTSGSTGTPKGVVVSERSVLEFVAWVTKFTDLDASLRFAGQAPPWFDNSVLDIFGPLHSGYSVRFVPRPLFANSEGLSHFIAKSEISALFWVPSAFRRLFDTRMEKELNGLRRVLLAGEAFPREFIAFSQSSLAPEVRAFNLYGPTEASVDCLGFELTREWAATWDASKLVPVGKERDGVEVILLDSTGRLIQDDGVLGELAIRGPSLALGYWRDPKKTSESFIQNPAHDNYPDRVYKTGDFGFRDSAGNWTVTGRKDSQVKIAGQRFELGEVEHSLESLLQIRTAICRAVEGRIECVLASEHDTQRPTDAEIVGLLRKFLSPPFLPSRLLWIEEIPLLSNGKVDRSEVWGRF